MGADKVRKSKALLDIESDSKTSIESKLLFCKNDNFIKSETLKQETSLPDKKPDIIPVPKSQVLGKVKDFLGVISEANKRLQADAEESSHKYDIEALTGDESEYIEMDLMLGVADLHTPEAVAAAESAISGLQPVISLADGSSDDDESSDGDNEDESDNDEKRSEATGTISSSEVKRNNRLKKRAKIIELP